LSAQIQPEDAIYYPLVTAISVLYARPFKHSKGIESLTLQFVPAKFHHLHGQLILLRDKTIAHVDARGVPLFQGLPANSVRYIVRGNQIALGVNRVKFKTTAILQIHELASALKKRMLEYVQKLASENPNDVPDDGEYLIDLTTGTFRRLRFD
jgi:hypothetical protein